ncbi:MAG: carboxypeptidase regulatory-like domain-containing protein [Pyrinomonadaceae bacterium]
MSKLGLVGAIAAAVIVAGYFYSNKPSQASFGIRTNELVESNIESRTAAAFSMSEPVSVTSKRENYQRSTSAQLVYSDRGRKLIDHRDSFPFAIDEKNPVFAEFTGTPISIASNSFDGLSSQDNVSTFGLLIAPPDMVGAAGPDHYVQVVNSLFRVFDKSGNPLTPPARISSLFTNLGTACSNRNDGLPNIIYDQLADRWLISQVCTNFPPYRQMIAVSVTGDPTGQWYVYEFVMPNVRLNDFPKISMWPDGYYMTTNEYFGSNFVGNGIFAFDRRKLLMGDSSAGYVYVSRPSSTPFAVGMLPADLDGFTPPPAGAAEIIATHNANEYGQPIDAIRLFEFQPNFEQPSLTTFTERPESPVFVAPFDPTSNEGRADISQPPPGMPLDAVSDTLMSRLAYRNLANRQSLVANQTVRTSATGQPYHAGVRVYEFRNSGNGFQPFVQTTIGDPNSSRWIGSAAQDNQGNLAVQYNSVSDEKRVSINYSGKLADDPSNVFRPEQTLIAGTGVQKGFGWRWGEYSAMRVDPTDDCTFWITNAYYSLESEMFSDFGWLTRIGNFKFDECTAAPAATVSGTVRDSITGQTIEGANLSAAAYSRRSDEAGAYGPFRMPPGDYELVASKFGYRDSTENISLADGQRAILDFKLEPIPAIQFSGSQITAESCSLDSAIDPGETVTIKIALQNLGSSNASDVTARLLPGGGITSPGKEQYYGNIASGGSPVSRPFTFTANSNHNCGTPLIAVFALTDGSTYLGNVTIQIPTGRDRVVLSESFDRGLPAYLPPRWTRSAARNDGLSATARNWTVSRKRNTSPGGSVFSPAPIQVGINELASPVFAVTTPNARLTFQNWYELETTFLRNRLYDGSILEIKIGDGAWKDIIAAGGEFESGGYDGVIESCCQNPLGGRMGWSGWSGINRPAEFITTSVKLPTAAAGQFVQLRWRVATDIGTFREGQYLDDIRITDGVACSCGS